MKVKLDIFIVILVAALVAIVTVPAGAAVEEIAYRGQVLSVNQSGGTMTISAGYQYGCNYSGAKPNCSWLPVPVSNLTGTVPDPAAFGVFRAGDQVAATSMGGPGGIWIGLAKIFPTPGIENWLATDIVGDPDSLPVGLASDYYFSYETAAECGNCTGSVCNARYANITLNSTTIPVLRKSLLPGGSAFYNGRNDNSSVLVGFVKGQALSDTCPGMSGMVGLQPVSVFTIHVNQAVAGSPPQVPGVTTLPSTPGGQAMPSTPGPSPAPTKAPSDLIVPIAALGVAGAVLLRKEI
ncbi:MAG TPA: hypothetical protein VMC42_04190 [Methanoregulaceae archaeon]|nr:hypothetical protein [Methanoregulaceae archaeon]